MTNLACWELNKDHIQLIEDFMQLSLECDEDWVKVIEAKLGMSEKNQVWVCMKILVGFLLIAVGVQLIVDLAKIGRI